ncbi:uncharacterized protein LOC135201053 isoform X2 [Macrobrachium nipponense]
MLEVHLACQSSPHKNFDIITVNAQEVCVSTYRSLTKAQETIKTPQFPEGWNEFSLSLEGPYTLRDGHGTTWISYNKSSECVYSRIKITGLLMRQCHKQMPTWEIEGPMKREVPLLSRGSTNFNEELILYSAEEFQPTFIISNIQLWIGWYNNSLEIREEASSLPVPRFTKRLFMSFIKEGSKMKLKIMAGDREIFLRTLQQRPTYLLAFGAQNDRYFLAQMLHQIENRTTAKEKVTVAHQYSDILLPSGFTVLCVVIIIKLGIWNIVLLAKFKEWLLAANACPRPLSKVVTNPSQHQGLEWSASVPPVAPPVFQHCPLSYE